MSISKSFIRPCLWFDNEGEEAAKFYTSIFPNSSIDKLSHYTDAGQEQHKQPAGKVLTVEFTINSQPFTALNGGAEAGIKFTPAISFQIDCQNQDEVDTYWRRLLEGGGKEMQCGWLADRFGVSWQIVPVQLSEMIASEDKVAGKRAMNAMMGMVKMDIAGLQAAFDGK